VLVFGPFPFYPGSIVAEGGHKIGVEPGKNYDAAPKVQFASDGLRGHNLGFFRDPEVSSIVTELRLSDIEDGLRFGDL
jgi:hypothetical protein